MKKSKDDILRLVEENDVKFIRLQFTDIFGMGKNVAITKQQLEGALDNKIMFDGSSVEGFVRIEESDMYLYPDYDSFVILPWKPQQGREARLICDVYMPNRTPFEGDPRYVLKRALAEAKSMGYDFQVGPECEFFLFDLDEKGQPTTKTNDEAGYFDLGHIDGGEDCRRDIALVLEEMGFDIEASHHECADGQHEIDFKYDEALTTADRIMTFKSVVKTIALRHNLHATFMPKPLFGTHGSGMHINMSLSKDGVNVFYDPNSENGLSDIAHSFIAGLIENIDAMTSVTNPLVNSYKRLVPGFEAPCYVAWSASNRTPLVRIPATRGAGTRVELRNPDPSANPYLAIAVCLMAGLDGVKRGLVPPKAVDENIYKIKKVDFEEKGIRSLPSSLEQAIALTKESEFMKQTLGMHVHTNYVKAKEKEVLDYNRRVSQWETDSYLKMY